jgi:hypothetical protein
MLLTGLDVVGQIAAAGGTAIIVNYGFTAEGARRQIIRLANGSAHVLVSTVAIIHAVAMDDTNVYWSESDNGLPNWETQAQIKTMPLAGGTIRVLASGQTDPRLVEVDAGTVYWANYGIAGTPGLGGVWRVAASGGTPVPIANQRPWVHRLSVGAGGVAYVEEARWKTQTDERRHWALMLSAR